MMRKERLSSTMQLVSEARKLFGIDCARWLLAKLEPNRTSAEPARPGCAGSEDVEAFIAQCIIKDEGAKAIQARDLYNAYIEFTAHRGGTAVNITVFGRKMGARFSKRHGGRVVFYYGIRLKLHRTLSDRTANEEKLDEQATAEKRIGG